MREVINVKEMMFGTGESFAYRQCGDCGSLQIDRPPDDMGKYYPSDYYSYRGERGVADTVGRYTRRLGVPLSKVPPLHRLARGVLGPFLARTTEWRIVKTLLPHPTSRFLDVGCGSGRSLKTLRLIGYVNLVGIDPFLGAIPNEPGLRFLRKSIDDMDGVFDVIMFNHSLEHIPSPQRVLAKAHSILATGGFVVLGTPIAQTHAWSKYRENWVQLDAPRHLFVPSMRGLERLSAASGFRLSRVFYDSSEFQFWGSEQYLRGVSLTSPESYCVNPKGGIFSSKEIETFRKMAKMLNECEQGDQVLVFLEKTPVPGV